VCADGSSNNPLRFQGLPRPRGKRFEIALTEPLGWVSCECDDGVLFLRGRLSSFYHKQLAQEVVARTAGVTQGITRFEVA